MREGRKRTQALCLALCDTLMVIGAMQLAWWLRFDVNDWLSKEFAWNIFMPSWGWTPKQPYILAVFVMLPLFWLILREMNLYAQPEDGAGEFFRLSAAALVTSVLLAAISNYVRLQNDQQQFQFSRAYLLLFLPSSVLCLTTGRALFRALLRVLAHRGIGQNRILFVGAGPLAEELARELDSRGTNKVIGTLSASSKVPLPEEKDSPPIEKLSNRILEDAFYQDATEIIIELGEMSDKKYSEVAALVAEIDAEARAIGLGPSYKTRESVVVKFKLKDEFVEQLYLPIDCHEALINRFRTMSGLNPFEIGRSDGAGRIDYKNFNPRFDFAAIVTIDDGNKRFYAKLDRATAKEKSDSLESGKIFPLKILGHANDLVEVSRYHNFDEVVVAMPEAPQELLKKLAEDCYKAHVRFRMVPDVYEMLLDHMDLSLVGDIPLLGMRGSRIEGINFLCKRLFDIFVSFVLLLLLVPFVFIPTIIALKLSGSGPAFYFQERLGFRRRTFRFWKFRTMRVGADSGGSVEEHKDYLKKYIAGAADGAKDEKGRTVYKLKDDPRVTPLGRFLRKYSIDELPQLWNVLKGDMSLIGPRPPIAYEVENYRPIHLRRFEVLPGISGLWQVSGRNLLTFDEMVKLDLYYIENWSLELDLRILFKTIGVVLFQKAH